MAQQMRINPDQPGFWAPSCNRIDEGQDFQPRTWDDLKIILIDIAYLLNVLSREVKNFTF